jgi:hypothetical protein
LLHACCASQGFSFAERIPEWRFTNKDKLTLHIHFSQDIAPDHLTSALRHALVQVQAFSSEASDVSISLIDHGSRWTPIMLEVLAQQLPNMAQFKFNIYMAQPLTDELMHPIMRLPRHMYAVMATSLDIRPDTFTQAAWMWEGLQFNTLDASSVLGLPLPKVTNNVRPLVACNTLDLSGIDMVRSYTACMCAAVFCKHAEAFKTVMQQHDHR